MAEGRTYRRVPQDVKEVNLIVSLIDAHVRDNAGKLATENTGELRDLLNTQARWHEIKADINAPEAPAATSKPRSEAPTESEGKEVKSEPRAARTTNVAK